VVAYTGILKNIKTPKSLISIPNSYLDVDIKDLKEFATSSRSNIAINARHDIDLPGFYKITYKVFDIPSFRFLDSKEILVEVREDGPNTPSCPYKNAKLCLPFI